MSQASERELALALDTAQILGTHQPVDAPLQVPDFQQGAELRKRALDEIRQVAPVPEPSGLAALGLGLAVLLRRKAKR